MYSFAILSAFLCFILAALPNRTTIRWEWLGIAFITLGFLIK